MIPLRAAALLVLVPLASALAEESGGLTVFEAFDRFTVVRAASELCEPGHKFPERFWTNDGAVRRLTERRVMEARPDLSRADIDATLQRRMRNLAKRTRKLVTGRGCGDENAASLIRLRRVLEEADLGAPG